MTGLLNEIKKRFGLPCTTAVSSNSSNEFVDAAPFVSPFSRGDRVYKIADWTGPSGKGISTSATSGYSSTSPSMPLAGIEEDWTLSLADATFSVSGAAGAGASMNTPVGRKAVRGVLPPRGITSSSGGASRSQTQKGSHSTGAKQLGWGQRGHHDHRQRQREPSVRIEPTWTVREEIEFPRLTKLAFDPEEPELVAAVGRIPLYNKALDKLTTKTPKAVIIDDSVSIQAYCSLAEDPVIARLAAEGVGSVFASDLAAALLMAAPRTLNPWDLQVTWKEVEGGRKVMLLDQRPGAHFHWTPVGESLTAELIEDSSVLSVEATKINSVLPALVSSGQEDDFIDLEPSNDTTTSGSEAFKYFKWSLGEDKAIVIRSALNCGDRVAGKGQVGLLRGLLDCSSLVDTSVRSSNLLDWRSKLDFQRGAVLAGEIKSNNASIARWVFQAELAQADLIKLAYVSRTSPKDRVRHELLALQDLEPHELAVQMSLDSANGFGILKALIDLLTQTEGVNVSIVRDPIKVTINATA